MPRPHALVGVDDGPVVGENRDDLLGEGAAVLGRGGPLVRQRGVVVESGTGQAPLRGDHLRGQALVEREVVIAGKHFRPVRHSRCPGGPERYPAHDLDTTGHHDVLLARHHRVHREVEGLLAGSASPVDGGARNALRPARSQDREASNIARLVADLGHAAPDHVVDDVWTDPGALQQFVEHDRGEVCGMDAGQPAVALAYSGTDGFDDDCFPHASAPISTPVPAPSTSKPSKRSLATYGGRIERISRKPQCGVACDVKSLPAKVLELAWSPTRRWEALPALARLMQRRREKRRLS
ncbi:hypothetical protein I546_5177 [Mycobacterium kansasii 732]|nr:hypothetical protein I546_5177 [Mycobacterium kansasii 732]